MPSPPGHQFGTNKVIYVSKLKNTLSGLISTAHMLAKPRCLSHRTAADIRDITLVAQNSDEIV